MHKFSTNASQSHIATLIELNFQEFPKSNELKTILIYPTIYMCYLFLWYGWRRLHEWLSFFTDWHCLVWYCAKIGVSFAANLFITKSSPAFLFSIIFNFASIDWMAVFLLNLVSDFEVVPAKTAMPNSGLGFSISSYKKMINKCAV